MVKLGEYAPDFETVTQSGETISTKKLKGKKFVLYFYPKDNTPGCTKEACSFRDNYMVFQKQGIPVFGVSGGTSQSHQKFIDKYNLPFPLLMDEKFELVKMFKAYKKGNRVARITYLIDENGKIEGIFGGDEGTEKVNTAEHAQQVINFWSL